MRRTQAIETAECILRRLRATADVALMRARVADEMLAKTRVASRVHDWQQVRDLHARLIDYLGLSEESQKTLDLCDEFELDVDDIEDELIKKEQMQRCDSCGVPHDPRALTTVDLDPGDPEVGPQPRVVDLCSFCSDEHASRDEPCC